MRSEAGILPDEDQDGDDAANDNQETPNPTIVDLPPTLPDELQQALARTLARVLVARAYKKLGIVPANDE